MSETAYPPVIYDLAQRLAGRHRSVKVLRHFFAPLAGHSVLDVGAGTSAWRPEMPALARYIWLDIEPARFAAARAGGRLQPADVGLVSSAAAIGLAARSVDYVVCVAVSHHLTDDQFNAALVEMSRVTRKGLIFLDALVVPSSLISRAMWAIDAGSHPRGADVLRQTVSRHFRITDERLYRTLHHYWVCSAEPRDR